MRLRAALVAAVGCLALALPTWRPATGAERYRAIMADGRVVDGPFPYGLLDGGGPPTLGGVHLFQGEHPVRALHDAQVEVRRPAAYVEMTNGDRLPGRVLRAAAPSEDPQTPPHLVVDASLPAEIGGSGNGLVRVREASLRRIVWNESDRDTPYEPGRVTARDGRSVVARRLRWTTAGVVALTEGEVWNLSFAELAELHVPDRGGATAALADGLWRQHLPDDRLARLRTSYGGEFTFPYSMAEQIQGLPRARGRGGLRWLRERAATVDTLAIQPAWALDPLLIPLDTFASCHFRPYHEVPLSLLPVVAAEERPLTHAWPWRRDRSVRGEVLRSGRLFADLGLGTHSYSALTFELPPSAESFSTWVGLDRAVGAGGCVECRIYQDAIAGEPLYASGFLRGGDAPQRIGPLDVRGARRLVLVTDYGHEGRPAGADPLDVRDHVNWLLPTVSVARESLPQSRDLAAWIPALEGWELAESDWPRVALVPTWDAERRRWRTSMVIDGALRVGESAPLRLTRQVEVSLANAFLPIEARRDARGGGFHVIRLEADGQPVRSTMNGDLRTSDTRVYILGDYAGQHITLSLVIEPHGNDDDRPSGVVWERAALSPLVRNLPADGRPIVPDVWLTSVTPIDHSLQGMPFAFQAGKLSHDGQPLHLRGYRFEQGFGVPTQSEMVYRLDPQWKRFVAVLGLADGWQGAGPYAVQIDDQIVWRSDGTYHRNSPGTQIDIPIPPDSRTLTLRLDGRESSGAWADAGFLTR